MYDRNDKVIPIHIEQEMKDSYISYAMSVIVGRALPDVKDGLKPVHRRILYSMRELHLEHSKAYKKCARIVGLTLGQYHPHGDTAVYDALVRMGQDFSMRYPLIDGQGNFGCFTKDTKVKLTDGRSLSFSELVREHKKKKRNFTFTLNTKEKKIEIAEIKNPRLTRKKASLVEVTLDNNKKIKCTPNHLFMLRDGTYKKAMELVSGESLMPLYIDAHDGAADANLKGYEMLYQPAQAKWDFIHHLADAWNIAKGTYKKNAGRIRHHKDFNKLNNDPANIQRIQWNQHWKLHKEIASDRHKNDPEYVKKLAEGRRKFWDDPEQKQAASLRWTLLNGKNWQNPAYRRKMSRVIREAWQRPEYRDKIIKSSSRNLKNLWKKKDFQGLMSELKSKELKKKWQDPTYRKFMAEVTKQMSLQLWSDPKHRKHISKLNKEYWSDLKHREKMSEQTKQLWKTSDYRNKYSADHFSAMAKKLWKDPRTREMHREKAIKQWRDQDFKAKLIKSVISSNKKRLENNPALMSCLAQKAAGSLREKWQDPAYKKRVLQGKILGHVNYLLSAGRKITPELYDQTRKRGLPSAKTALKYFADFKDITTQARQKLNHKVRRVKVLREKEDVYDLTVEQWHNFSLAAGVFVHNSIDGDPAAAMRYTEARLARIADEMLADIDKETVDFMPNFDDSLQEPVLLPAVLPNLLINGSSGIAVGMATNIPSHNLSEVIDGVAAVIDDPDIDFKGLRKIIKGPDFPTGAIICGRKGIEDAYRTGRGLLKLHAKAHIETPKTGRERIIITEIPYQVNKSNLIESIAKLVQEKRVEGIADLRDESDKDGIRVVIELRRDAIGQVVLNRLYKHTQMQTTFGVIMLALVDNKPRVLTLKQMLELFIEHRREVITRRTKFELRKAQERAHILEGLKIAVSNIDKIIQIIKKSKTPSVAKEQLMAKFGLTDIQAQAILEMQLQRLTGLERDKIEKEYLELIKRIEFLKSILDNPKKVLQIIKEELSKLKEKYGDERQTQITAEAEDLDIEDLIAEEDVVITISNAGYIKRLPVSSYRKQRRGGKGMTGAGTREEDFIEHLFIASTHESILFFTNLGRVYWLKVHEIPQAGRISKGKAIINMLQLSKDECVAAFVRVKEFKEGSFLVMGTKKGLVKKTDLAAFSRPRKGGIVGISIEKQDELISVRLTDGRKEILMATRAGKAIRFPEKQVRDMGRGAKGVKGITLGKQDEVIAMEIVDPKTAILTVTELGFAKRTTASEYRTQSRGGKGIINIKVAKKNGEAVSLKIVGDKDELMAITTGGTIVRCPVKDIRTTGRSAQGVRLIRLSGKDKVASVARVIAEEEVTAEDAATEE